MHIPPGVRKFPARQTRRFAVALALVAAVRAPAQAPAPARADSAGTLVGFVTMREGGQPLPYSVISIAALSREQFTNDRGTFVLAGLPAGRHRLRVRHLGYSPADVDVVIRAGGTDTVRVALTRIAVRLNAVQVRAYPECTNPGPPDARDSAFALVFDQLKQNAEQFRLLTKEYPFAYAVERTLGAVFGRDNARREKPDTIVLRSADEWRYVPGEVVTQERRALIFRGPVMMHIPSLAHFADERFIANHCFHNGGLETIGGQDLVRVDFVAATRIRSPDVDGSMYLDPATFQIRRTFLHLSRAPSALPDLLETEATTVFAELYPSIPVITTISSVSRLRPPRGRLTLNPPTATTEDQRLIAVEFTGRKPGEDAKKP
jgi:hypothetical protein